MCPEYADHELGGSRSEVGGLDEDRSNVDRPKVVARQQHYY
jgi:hypothetical protein